METNNENKDLKQQVTELSKALQRLSAKQDTQHTDVLLLLKDIDGKLQLRGIGAPSDDEVYGDTKEAVIDAGVASTSYLQRALG